MVAEEDAEGWVMIEPAKDTLVLVGCIENQLSNMYLLQCGAVSKIKVLIGDTLINADKDAVSVQQGKLILEMEEGLFKVSNDKTSLKGLFDDLTSILQNFKVVTSQGPSTALFADTLTAVSNFKTKYPKLLA